jgi:hypothetical protein
MSAADVLPLSIREVKPHPLAVNYCGTRSDGLPDGFHTGGVYLLKRNGNNLVYKPLDGRPCPNCDGHVPTMEAAALHALAGLPFFPRNWWIEERNGRRFLVRPWATIVHPRDLGLEMLWRIAEAVSAANRRQWEIGDLITVGKIGEEWFIVDLSTAHYCEYNATWPADDAAFVGRLFEYAGRKEEWEKRRRELLEAQEAALLAKLHARAQAQVLTATTESGIIPVY